MGAKQQGFSLLEMIAAIMILAVALTALLMLAGGSRHLQQQAARQATLAMDARSLLDAAFATGAPQAGMAQGTLADGCRWRLQTEPLDGQPRVAGIRLYRLNLELTWGPLQHPHLELFHTVRIARESSSGATS